MTEEQLEQPKSDIELLRALVDQRTTFQKSRVAFGNRISAVERGDDVVSPRVLEVLERWHETLEEMEGEITGDITSMAAEVPVIVEMANVKGVGFMTAAKVVALVGGDISTFTTVSKLWRFAGYAVIDGEAERLRRGEKAHFNRRLKTACWLLASGLMKVKGDYYNKSYLPAREYYDNNRPDWSDGRRHAAALRKMTKLFLSHLWETWRTMEGHPIRAPYAISALGHSYSSPQDFGWEPLGIEPVYVEEHREGWVGMEEAKGAK
jgi:hypothetical protein